MDSGDVNPKQLNDEPLRRGDQVGGGIRMVELRYNTTTGFWEGRVTPPIPSRRDWMVSFVSVCVPPVMPKNEKTLTRDVLWLSVEEPACEDPGAGQTVDWQWNTEDVLRVTVQTPPRWFALKRLYKDVNFMRVCISSFDGKKHEAMYKVDGLVYYLELDFALQPC